MSFDLLAFLAHNQQLSESEHFTVRGLTGGYWNQVNRLQGSGVDWIVKIYSEARPYSLFPILPELEATTLKNLNGLAISPDFIAYYPARHNSNPAILIYEFLQGETWQADVQPVATLFRKVHQLPPDNFQKLRHLPVTPTDILSAGDHFLEQIQNKKSAKQLLGKRPGIKATPQLLRPTLVHVDSGAGNIVVTPAGPRLIDWQCPGLGDPVEDINCFLSPAFHILYGHAPLTAQEIDDFLLAYNDNEVVERYWALLPYLTYRMAAHCCLQAEQRRVSDPEAGQAYLRALELSLTLL